MRAVTRILVPLALVTLAHGPVRADVPAAVELRAEVYVVHLDPESADASLTALATIPAAVRHAGTTGRVSQALLISDDAENPTNVRLLERFKSRVAAEGVDRLVFVGAVPAERRAAIAAGLGNPSTTALEGDPATISRGLAALISSEQPPVEFILPQDRSTADLTAAANAAVAASSQGKGLIFTTGTPSARNDIGRILGETKVTTVCLVHKKEQLVPATFAAAHYKGVVAEIPGKMAEDVNRLDERVVASSKSIQKLEILPPRDEQLHLAQTESARSVIDWLAAQGLDRADKLEVLMVFARPRKWWFWGLGYSFDRELAGSPLAPEKPGALVGRFPLDPQENLAVLNRSTLHQVLSNPAGVPKKALLSFVAYEANHAGPGSYGPWRDNFGADHKVNELVGIPGSEPGIHPLLKARGIEMTFNNGWAASETPRKDPLEGTSAVGFMSRMNEGVSVFYSSSHGSDNAFYPFEQDTSIQDDVQFGDPAWPCKSGRFTTMGSTCSASYLDEQLQDVHGLVAIFNACLVANGDVGPNLLRHGARAVVASYISVSFDGAGWWGVKAMESLAAGASIAEAMCFAYAHTSEIFAANLPGVDHTLRYIVIGDPHANCW